jgi:hypothetical protein
MRFTEYRIAIASTPENLVAEVNKLIKDRWQPCGGMVVTREVVSGIRETFMQPMVREANKRAGRLNKASEHVPQSLKPQTNT